MAYGFFMLLQRWVLIHHVVFEWLLFCICLNFAQNLWSEEYNDKRKGDTLMVVISYSA